MAILKENKKISIKFSEYRRLKTLDERFGDLLNYVNHLADIREARKEAGKGEIVSQELLFRRLGI